MPDETAKPPPADFATRRLSVRTLDAARLVRISRIPPEREPFFGRTGTNRFDDPEPREGARYGVLYAALDLLAAFGETVLHEDETEKPAGPGGVVLSAKSIEERRVLSFRSAPLRPARMYGKWLKGLGGTGGIATVIPYDIPQRWSKAVFWHPQVVDGLIYMSRNVNDRSCVAVFDRAAGKLKRANASELNAHRDLRSVLRAFRLTLVDE